jgi:hypothetical protein
MLVQINKTLAVNAEPVAGHQSGRRSGVWEIKMKLLNILVLPAFLAMLICLPCQAVQRIAVLNFELNDITSLPNTLAEQQRTASVQPLLEQAISQLAGYEIVHIPQQAQQAANAGFGYLFRFDDIAAGLAKPYGADWLVVGQHSKPSFLFSYLMIHLINVHNPAQVIHFDIELKGNHQKVTDRAVKALSRKIDVFLSR